MSLTVIWSRSPFTVPNTREYTISNSARMAYPSRFSHLAVRILNNCRLSRRRRRREVSFLLPHLRTQVTKDERKGLEEARAPPERGVSHRTGHEFITLSPSARFHWHAWMMKNDLGREKQFKEAEVDGPESRRTYLKFKTILRAVA